MPLLSYSLFFSGHEPVDSKVSDGHPPLIFVHGLGGSRGDFLPMSLFLWTKGRKRSYRIKFERGQSIEKRAEVLAKFIRQVKKVTREKQVDIVAHSMGGLVARWAVFKHGLEKTVKTLITLGTPHHGTHPARYLHTQITRHLRPESDLLRELNRKRWPKSIRGITFWSQNDLFILPAHSAILEGTEVVDMTPFTHYSYLIDPKAWAAVYYKLHH
jgi:triacylglycerol esterase/lipase EstA (alpha/beta hydrolase family)